MSGRGTSRAGLSRRGLLAGAGAGPVAAALAVATEHGLLGPTEARARGVALARLTDAEASTLGALGDTLLPGAEAAGVVHFVDDQLGREHPLFILRYLDWTGPYLEFYRDGLAAVDALAETALGMPFAECSSEQRVDLVTGFSAATPDGWTETAPPSPLFFFVVRNDAIDVVYGTEDGFAKLGVPYMAHVAPVERW